MLQARLERRAAHRFDPNCMAAGVVTVPPVHFFQTPAQLRLVLGRQPLVRFAVLRAGPLVQHEARLAMQPVRCPIGGYVAAVAPHRADFHPAERLPYVLAALDIAFGHHHPAACIHHPGRDRWHLLVNPRADPAQHGERSEKHHREADPQLLHAPYLETPAYWPARPPSVTGVT